MSRASTASVRCWYVPLMLKWAVRQGAASVVSVVSYPHGASTTASKLYETRDLLRRRV